VVFNRHTQGAIESIDVDMVDMNNLVLVVLGQRVRINNMTTQFGNTLFDDLGVGDIVAISGFEDANGVLRATWVNKIPTPGFEIEATGTITNLDEASQTFTLNMLTVNFSGANLSDVPGGQLADGQIVEVISSQNGGGDILLADRVAVQPVGLQGEPGEAAELQGIITQITAPNTFEVNGQVVHITPATIFEKGTPDDIALNVLVELEGVFNANGVIIADEVEYAADVELRGVINDIISDDLFEVEGKTIRITPDTTIHPGAVDDLLVNVQVEVDGFFNMDGVMVATEIELFLEGPITDIINGNTFEVDGQVVRVTPGTVFEQGTDDDIAMNVQVEVEGFFDENNIFVATEVEFLL
jgi:hypothetical protein